jgi:hypothetical protein
MRFLLSEMRRGRRWLIRNTRRPRVGAVDFGTFARLDPVSRDWGFDRGTPVDRHYIEGFLKAHSGDIRGDILEIADNAYTLRFGGDKVRKSDILQPVEGDAKATVIADLGTGEGVPTGRYDCIICTQTLQFIYQTHKAIASLHKMLRSSGVLLMTVPGISQISREDMERTGDYWRFTTASINRLLTESFGDSVTVQSVGNVYAATAFLQGVAVEELDLDSLGISDPQYQLLLVCRAVRGK